MQDAVRQYLAQIQRVRASLDEGVARDRIAGYFLRQIKEALEDGRYQTAEQIYREERVRHAPDLAGDLGPPPPRPKPPR